ncbi:MAG: heme ABC exporter ATP-binding protein CcmA [Vicinamibacterales bacterium]
MLEIQGLSRRFDERVAVDDLSLTVGAGEIVSLLGPNGAGKTTTFRMVAGLLAPERGRIAIAGTPLTAATADALRGQVGLLTETPGLWERLSVRRNLETYAALHGVADAGTRVAQVMTEAGIDDRADERAGALSKGLRQRVALARALIHDPPVLLLDEPTSGLDPSSARLVRDRIDACRREGRAVLVSTHNLEEAEALSDRVAVLRTRLLACDTPERLRERRQARFVDVEVDGAAAAGALPRRPPAAASSRHTGNARRRRHDRVDGTGCGHGAGRRRGPSPPGGAAGCVTRGRVSRPGRERWLNRRPGDASCRLRARMRTRFAASRRCWYLPRSWPSG